MPKAKSPGKKPEASQFNEKVLPRLGDVMDWARAGADQKEIAAQLDISYSTFRSWVKKGQEGEERYVPLSAILAQAQEAPNREVEAALYKRARGYTAQETIEEIRQNADGEVTGTVTKHITREVPPDPTSIVFLLRNRMPGKWRKDPETDQGEDEGNTGVIQIPKVEPVGETTDGQ